jgi:peptidoglycan/xylan/chitin deacetylase (PgdA/CDA1 family)
MTINLIIHDVSDRFDSGFQTNKYKDFIISVESFYKLIELIELLRDIGIDTHLTIDDGGKSNLFIAEELYKKNIVATFFIATKFINTNRFMNGEDIKYIHSLGHNIGAHSHSHYIPFELLSFEDQLKDWSESVSILTEILGLPVRTISFPGGSYNDSTLRILASLGVESAYSSIPDPFLKFHDRIEIYGRFCVMSKSNIDYLYTMLIHKKLIFQYYIIIYNFKRFIKRILPCFSKWYTSKYINI